MFLQARSKLIFILAFFCYVSLPSQVFGMTNNRMIQNKINIDSPPIYSVCSHNTFCSSQAPDWIYTGWIWSRNSRSTNLAPYRWCPGESTAHLPEPEDLKYISGDALILSPPDAEL
ncbi:hypothetical protein V144x_24040 [Gimesia aquarii]|uniref:Uncharacterized protein n=1 Tax=Gimesia aquarii TaxID=2527964 RepID=A0A517VV99_9PLAN|nr:hypothetical protein V144x_24040 [Gimesia aquarii]